MILIIIVIGIVYYFYKPDTANEIKNYLLNSGYVVDSSEPSLLSKRTASNIVDYFSLTDYTLNEEREEESSNISSILNQTYDFKNPRVYYNYHITYSDNINVIFKGEYQDNHFTCEKEFSTASLSSNDIDNTCNLIKIRVSDFYNSSAVLFNNYEFIKYMQNIKVE